MDLSLRQCAAVAVSGLIVIASYRFQADLNFFQWVGIGIAVLFMNLSASDKTQKLTDTYIWTPLTAAIIAIVIYVVVAPFAYFAGTADVKEIANSNRCVKDAVKRSTSTVTPRELNGMKNQCATGPVVQPTVVENESLSKQKQAAQ
jgi:hypothetical protein